MMRRAATQMIGIRNMDIACCQFNALRHGDVSAFRSANERAALRIGCDLMFAMNTLDGGTGESGVRGETGFWMMSASEITRYGQVLIASDAGIWFNMWRFYTSDESRFSAHYNSAAVQNAIAGLADLCASEVR
jgi:hypothetical protein